MSIVFIRPEGGNYMCWWLINVNHATSELGRNRCIILRSYLNYLNWNCVLANMIGLFFLLFIFEVYMNPSFELRSLNFEATNTKLWGSHLLGESMITPSEDITTPAGWRKKLNITQTYHNLSTRKQTGKRTNKHRKNEKKKTTMKKSRTKSRKNSKKKEENKLYL